MGTEAKSRSVREILLRGVFWRVLIIEAILLVFSLIYRWQTADVDFFDLFWYAVRIILLVAVIILFIMITLKPFLNRHIIMPLETIAAANREIAKDFTQTMPLELPRGAPAEINSIITTRTAMLEHILEISQKRLQLYELIKIIFGRYLSEKVVDEILSSPRGHELGGRRQTVTILMSDLRGFTSLSETRDPEEMVQVLNRYLEEMSEIIFKHDGIIDEILGDAILAVFGAPERHADDPERAVVCAIEMQNSLINLNQTLAADGYSPLEMGIGIDTGTVIVGNIGSRRRMKYGIVGDTVNRTSRIEANSIGGQVLIGESTFNVLGSLVTTEPPKTVMMKGMQAPLVFFPVTAINTVNGRMALQTLKAEDHRIGIRIPVQCRIIQDKRVASATIAGTTLSIDQKLIMALLNSPVQPLTDVRLTLEFCRQAHCFDDIYAKCVSQTPRQNQFECVFHITAMTIKDRALIQKWIHETSITSETPDG